MAWKNIPTTLLFLLGSIAVSFLLYKLTGWFFFFLLIPFVFVWPRKKR